MLAAGVALTLAFGRDALANARDLIDLAEQTGEVPSWLLYGVPVLAALVLAGVTSYLAFGRRLALKVLGLAVVVAALAAPGFALGWTNGTVSTVGDRTPEVEERVDRTRRELQPPLPGKAVNVLLIGSDKQQQLVDDPGRSDSQILVRLDPVTKRVSMLSLPRDLLVEIPGYGSAKLNEAYSYGGPALTVKTFRQLTGLPIHHFMEVDFGGFWHVVNILGGVYVSVDRRYYNPEYSDWKSIDIEPGYQLLRGHDALDYVRFRHDQKGDFTRIQRQQLFLKELQRQSDRWNDDWRRVGRMLKAITEETTSDLDSLRQLLPLASLALTLDTSRVTTVHVEGETPLIDGVAYVTAAQEEIDDAVREFMHPLTTHERTSQAVPKSAYQVLVYNANGYTGMAASTAEQLAALDYRARAVTNADEVVAATLVYAPEGLEAAARQVARLVAPAEVRLAPRAPGSAQALKVLIGTEFDGVIDAPEETVEPDLTILEDQRYAWEEWEQLDAQTPLRLVAPTVWSPGLGYDEFRAYKLRTIEGKQSPATIAVGTTPQGGYWGIQALRWNRPPAVADPSEIKVIDGKRYLLFYQGQRLHMVAWKHDSVLFWVVNTLDNELPEKLMLALATSSRPVSP
jgi:LCP family protein required for cell wall assembly